MQRESTHRGQKQPNYAHLFELRLSKPQSIGEPSSLGLYVRLNAVREQARMSHHELGGREGAEWRRYGWSALMMLVLKKGFGMLAKNGAI